MSCILIWSLSCWLLSTISFCRRAVWSGSIWVHTSKLATVYGWHESEPEGAIPDQLPPHRWSIQPSRLSGPQHDVDADEPDDVAVLGIVQLSGLSCGVWCTIANSISSRTLENTQRRRDDLHHVRHLSCLPTGVWHPANLALCLWYWHARSW